MEAYVFYASMEEMVKKFLLVIPNIAAAIAILVIGYIIARILKALAIKFLTSTKLFAKVEELKIPEKESTVDIRETNLLPRHALCPIGLLQCPQSADHCRAD